MGFIHPGLTWDSLKSSSASFSNGLTQQFQHPPWFFVLQFIPSYPEGRPTKQPTNQPNKQAQSWIPSQKCYYDAYPGSSYGRKEGLPKRLQCWAPNKCLPLVADMEQFPQSPGWESRGSSSHHHSHHVICSVNMSLIHSEYMWIPIEMHPLENSCVTWTKARYGLGIWMALRVVSRGSVQQQVSCSHLRSSSKCQTSLKWSMFVQTCSNIRHVQT